MKRVNGKFFLFGVFIGLFLFIAYLLNRPDGLLHIVFCDVGQGDGIYIRFPNGDDGLIDGGPNHDILVCLGKHMPFWDRTIELVVLTHPQSDHFAGLTEVLNRYTVNLLLVPAVENPAKSYQMFKKSAKISAARIHNPYRDERLRVGESVTLSVLWPERKWVANKFKVQSEKFPPKADLHQRWMSLWLKPLAEKVTKTDSVLGVSTTHDDLNDFSIVLLMSYKSFDVLFTGDAEYDILEPIVVQKNILREKELEILKVGHHGGKNALSGKLAASLDPDLSVISVGAKNSYGHPAQVTLDLLVAEGSKIARTDLEGEIEVVTDGEKWTYKSEKAGN
ncbi:hypothetical protein HY468_01665 [Candidatus Roizmanbacteria bacterium]|nr:hypothetical protein [Candidatus Roizmanbacteria bacterium]